jgi:hypothetical protein
VRFLFGFTLGKRGSVVELDSSVRPWGAERSMRKGDVGRKLKARRGGREGRLVGRLGNFST